MKSWHFVYLHNFLELNTLVIEFKYRFLLISIAPPISFSSVEELFSKPIILFSYMKLLINTLSKRPNLQEKDWRKKV